MKRTLTHLLSNFWFTLMNLMFSFCWTDCHGSGFFLLQTTEGSEKKKKIGEKEEEEIRVFSK